MKRIPLANDRGFTLVDDEDHEALSERRWHLVPTRGSSYARSGCPGAWIYMHRLLMDAPPDMQVDHINRDGLDNRRSNLRLCTHAENGQNRVAQRDSKSSRFWGVYLHKGSGKWMVRHTIKGEHHYIGTFTDEVKAARAAEAFRNEHMPFAQPDPELLALDQLEAWAT